MITIGLDFGTHQTKVCIEDKNGTETHYKFHKFMDNEGNMHYTLPSIICITPDNKLKYGYVDVNTKGSFKRYFKQAVFKDVNSPNMQLWEAACYSIWYLAFILFDLEKKYGNEFTVQMGAPTDSSHIDDRKAIAVSILASAYKLVEDVFHNDKQAFLDTDYNKLLELTEIVRYSDKIKKIYGILVFPESYACLMPIIGRGKIAHGMNLIVDIGGGTTDISFFTIEETIKKSKVYHPQLYDFYSFNKGLNYLTLQDTASDALIFKDVHIIKEGEIDRGRSTVFFGEINNICNSLIERLKGEWTSQTIHNKEKLLNALKNRPILYTGGGSTIGMLRKSYGGFQEIHLISYDSWKSKQFDDDTLFSNRALCPILSTAYGLSISVANDVIEKKPFRDIFKDRRGDEDDNGSGRFDYGVDYEAWK
ncbi:MAG: hypothetical protein E7102_12775 [Prevotella ruminicola]|uniref:Uncharacterized protein n=1 Tax=Xylanibacter ruminicola TaxID=839 RepID=A0A928BTZ2_XYLRU|nr:hypothetical protein [Xylanibacter ruminicola]